MLVSDLPASEVPASLAIGLNGKVLSIVVYPDERLKTVSESVTCFDEKLVTLASNMLATMRARNGIGLAAPQIGVNKCILVVQVDKEFPFVLINPEVTKYFEYHDFTIEEGCLSVPGYFEKRTRPGMINVKCQNLKGELCSFVLTGIHAFVVQHEIDHLCGKLFIDGLSQLKKDRIKARIAKKR